MADYDSSTLKFFSDKNVNCADDACSVVLLRIAPKNIAQNMYKTNHHTVELRKSFGTYFVLLRMRLSGENFKLLLRLRSPAIVKHKVEFLGVFSYFLLKIE